MANEMKFYVVNRQDKKLLAKDNTFTATSPEDPNAYSADSMSDAMRHTMSLNLNRTQFVILPGRFIK